jgi:energy-converting hydrogenase A subunit M
MTNKKQIYLENYYFSIYILHQVAKSWNKSVPDTYQILVDTGILDEYIIEAYDTLHTMGKEYLITDITEFARERGATTMNRQIDADTMHVLYQTHHDEDIIKVLAEKIHIDLRQAMDIYYKSKLARQIDAGEYGIQYLDARYLADDLIENEPELFYTDSM